MAKTPEDSEFPDTASPPEGDPRALIDAPALIKLLQDHATGDDTLERDRLQAVTVLLKKVLPDLTTVEAQAVPRAPAVVSAAPMSAEEWERIHGNP